MAKKKSTVKKAAKEAIKPLPSLDELVSKEETVKVTLSLNKSSVDYFKKEARKRSACYQAMIRALLDEYVKRYG